jgi:hypothetical protein
MKAPKPTIPQGAPKGATWHGGPIEWFVLRLTITSKDLILGEVTSLMGRDPDEAWEEGKPLLQEDGSIKRVPKFGRWSVELRPSETDEWDCGQAMMELLRRLPSDLGLWRKLTSRYKVDVSFALLMTSRNKGFELAPEVMKYLGDRGIAAGFDVYYKRGEKIEPDVAPDRRPTRPLAGRKRRKARRPPRPVRRQANL